MALWCVWKIIIVLPIDLSTFHVLTNVHVTFADYFYPSFFSMAKKPGTWLSTTIRTGNETITLQSALLKWSKSLYQPVRVSDSCLGAMCNPACPEVLKFVDTAADWGEVLNRVVLILSLVLTVVCVVAKICFMIQLVLLKRSWSRYKEKDIKHSQVKVLNNHTFLFLCSPIH